MIKSNYIKKIFSLSPDLNPDEQVGGRIKALARALKPVVTSNDDLWDAVEKAYNELSKDRQFFINLVNSMPSRLSKVLNAQGDNTKY